jgi:hypothetical protein
MNTLIDTPASATHSEGMLSLLMEDGLEFSFPCASYPLLATASCPCLIPVTGGTPVLLFLSSRGEVGFERLCF